MTLAEKCTFIDQLTENVRRQVIRRVEQLPEEWDGIELRRLIARAFEEAVMGSWSRKQARDFNNECTVRNLP